MHLTPRFAAAGSKRKLDGVDSVRNIDLLYLLMEVSQMMICAKADNRKLNDCTRGTACVCLNEYRQQFEDLYVNCRHVNNDLKSVWKERYTTEYVIPEMQHRFEGFVLAKESVINSKPE